MIYEGVKAGSNYQYVTLETQINANQRRFKLALISVLIMSDFTFDTPS